MDVQILLYEGFDELDVVGPFEVFANAMRVAERRVDERSKSTDGASGARSEESEDRGPRDRRPEEAVSGDAASSEATETASSAGNREDSEREAKRSASSAGDQGTVSLRTLSPVEQVCASHGLRVEPDGPLGEPDLLVVPGGGWNDRADAGAWAEAERGDVPFALAACHRRGATVASVCTGGLLLARAGLLDGRPAITHRSALADLRATDAEVVDARVVDDGDVVTAGGVTSGIDLALHLVAREFGTEVADRVADTMEYERTGDVYRA